MNVFLDYCDAQVSVIESDSVTFSLTFYEIFRYVFEVCMF